LRVSAVGVLVSVGGAPDWVCEKLAVPAASSTTMAPPQNRRAPGANSLENIFSNDADVIGIKERTSPRNCIVLAVSAKTCR